MSDDYTDFPKPTPELKDAIARERGGLFMKYFVLKPAGDSNYAIASRRAMQAYAKWIADENYELAIELNRWAGREHDASITRRMEAEDK